MLWDRGLRFSQLLANLKIDPAGRFRSVSVSFRGRGPGRDARLFYLCTIALPA